MKTTRILLSLLACVWVALPSVATDITVNSNEDSAMAGDMKCTLREAITNANMDMDTTGGDCAAGGGADVILFNIGGGGAQTISPTSALPAITAPVTIAGGSQSGFAGTPLIEIDGTNAGMGVDGLTLSNHIFSFVYNLVINRFATDAMQNGGAGIRLSGGGSHVIQGNYVGTDVTGTMDKGNERWGIAIQNSDGNAIGGLAAADRNLVSGNNVAGILIQTGADNNVVQGNYVGTNAAGTGALANGNNGVFILQGATNTLVGGTAPGAGNLISGSPTGISIGNTTTTGTLVQGNLIGTDATGTLDLGNSTGISINSAPNSIIGGSAAGARNVIAGHSIAGIDIFNLVADGNVVQGNLIGTDITGTQSLPNDIGVRIRDGGSGPAKNNTIGGTAAGEGNMIAFSTQDGVVIINDFGSFPTGNRIQGNSIFSNGGLGIDLHNDGVTGNDANDPDTIENNGQNFPELVSACVSAGNTVIQGTLNSTPNTGFTVEFFSNAAADASGNGEGQTFLGSTMVMTDAGGDVSFSTSLAVAVTTGHFVTSTATDPIGNTSEFSTNVVAFANMPPQIDQGAGPLALNVNANSTCPAAANQVDLSGSDAETPPADLHWSISGPPATGTATFVGGNTGPNVTLCYRPNAGQIAADSFTVRLADDCGGADTVQINVAVRDVTAPNITCPAAATMVLGQPTDPAALGSASATDDFDAAPNSSFTDATAAGACPALQVITRTWTATDASGNSATCQQTITVNDIDEDGDGSLNCADAAPTCGLCGAGTAAILPLTLIGLMLNRRRG